MKKHFIKLSILLMAIALVLSPMTASAVGKPCDQKNCFSKAAVQLKGDMRKLWMEHALWTRTYMNSALAGLEDQELVLKRLLKNQEDIGNAIKPIYGEEAGNKLTELLKEHIVIAGKIVDAAKKGDQATLQQQNQEWYRNADDMAKFLSSANPNWKESDLKELLHMHLQMVTNELVARLHKDWQANIDAFDKGVNHLIKLADALSDGIIKQFPNKF
ncbi:glycosyltransferase [Peribacillus alkalitolerans]|uniref:glycosyltransferase n=1 Tax=Peribacillus alkalitolerans TaxID=1550385 RepID=UPI0013CF9991|nr:glycosyltransferase [Peribacillus alkalitolerans]